jgi:hypothetical protein
MQQFLMLSFISLFLSLQVKTRNEIVGRWEAMETTRGGLGSTLEFGRDGSFTFPFGPLLHGTYKLDGDKLITTTFQPPPESATTKTEEIKIEGNTLIQKTEEGILSLVRLSPRAPGSPPIVGRWGMKAIYDFRRDGTFDLSSFHSSPAVVGMNKGTYKLDGNHVYITFSARDARGEPVSQEIEIRGDTLVMRLNDPPRNTLMRRIGPSNAKDPAIIGKWSVIAADGTDVFGFTEYKQNGEWVFRMPIMVRKGRYDIRGNLLTITFENADVKISRFRFESGVLVLKSPPETGPEDKFKRIE